VIIYCIRIYCGGRIMENHSALVSILRLPVKRATKRKEKERLTNFRNKNAPDCLDGPPGSVAKENCDEPPNYSQKYYK